MKRTAKMIKTAAVILVLAAAAGTYGAEFDLDQVRRDVEALNREWTEEVWNGDAYGEVVDRASLMAKYPYLTNNKELVDFLKSEYESEKDPVEKQRLRLLYWDISGTYMLDKMAGIYDELDNTRARALFYSRYFDEPTAYRDFSYYYNNLGKEETDKRADLFFEDTNFAINILNPLHLERIDELQKNSEELGFGSYTAYDEYATGFDNSAMAEQAYRFLDDTRDMYEKVVTDKCREILGKDPRETVPWERGIIWQTKVYDEYFPAEKMLPFAYDFFGAMGLDLKNNPNIIIDDEDREKKEPRAACFSFSVPGDVRINLKPLGGMDDYGTLFHETGHAFHYAYTDPNLPYEFRHLGTNSLSETYAFLFGALFMSPIFLKEEVGMPAEKVDEYLDIAFLSDLSGARYYAMNVIYEKELHGAALEDPLAFFVEQRLEYGVFPREPYQDESGYLEVDEEFYSRDYMTAWYAEAQLRAKLEEKFGERWYKDPAAGAFLRELFFRGDSWSTEEMLSYIGYEGLDSSYLARDFAEMYASFESDR